MSTASMEFHVLSFEGVDSYSRAGGLATRVEGLTDGWHPSASRPICGSSGIPACRGTRGEGTSTCIDGPSGSVDTTRVASTTERSANRPSSRGRSLLTW